MWTPAHFSPGGAGEYHGRLTVLPRWSSVPVSRYFQPFLLSVCLLLVGASARASSLVVPVTLDLAVVEEALATQLFTRDGVAELFQDAIQCNRVQLSDPQLSGTPEGQLRLTTRLTAQVGTPLGNRCLLPFRWSGVIETLETVEVVAGERVNFRVVDSSILRPDEQGKPLSGMAWDFIKGHVHPRLSQVSVNLAPALGDLRGLLRESLPADPATRDAVADSLVLLRATVAPEGLQVAFGLDVPPLPEDWEAAEEPPLSDEELAEWDAAWRAWDGFATWLIKDLSAPASPEVREALVQVLVDARYSLRDALAEDRPDQDAVRRLFLDAWSQLAPLLRDNPIELPGMRSLQLATFLSAGDALQAIDSAAPHLGVSLDSNALRRMARMLSPQVSDSELAWSVEVDPALRALLGLAPEFEEEPPAELPPFAWLIKQARAATVSAELVQRLTPWAPNRDDIDSYLPVMEELIDQAIRAEWQRGKVPTPYFKLYEDLVRATAWQETCWRQFVVREGEVLPIQSSAGSVGLMQINQHVWRGIYDLDRLRNDVGYNARAGNEILSHYLVDYAIRRGEHEARGNIDDLAYATYAVYNGGPRHLTRYRVPEKSNAYLRGVDKAFREKYEAIREDGFSAVKACYGS